ncbi:MAG: hypothetical protein DMG21_05385 [Acidobacteria bacterium]|nr:MAG: hypothetical protein DMG21_05385 [Acidobacteriota bacterium]
MSQFERPVAAVYDRRPILLIISALIERRYSKLTRYRQIIRVGAKEIFEYDGALPRRLEYF